MNFVEALEFMQAVNKFCFKARAAKGVAKNIPKMLLYDSEKGGYSIWIKMEFASKEFLRFLKEIVTTRELMLARPTAS